MPERGMNNHHNHHGHHMVRRSPEKDLEERKPFNSMDTDNGEVHFQKTGKPSSHGGCYLSKAALLLIACLLILLIILIGVIIALVLSKKPCSDCSSNSDTSSSSLAALNSSVVSSVSKIQRPTPISPHLPWSGIRLPKAIVPHFYKLILKVDLKKFIFTGSVEIDFRMAYSSRYVVLHSNELKIDERRVSLLDVRENSILYPENYIPVPQNQFFVVEMREDLSAGRYYRIVIDFFQGELQDDLAGLYRSMYKDKDGNTRYLAVSQLQPVDARKVFPCFDEPDLKANFSVSITRQSGYTALSNMPLKSSKYLSDNWITDSFETTPVMSTYLLAFVVADFSYEQFVTPGGLLTISIWSQPDKVSQTNYALHFAQQVYSFFSNYFGTTEVVPKADHVAIPDFSAGAMENWGLVLYRETALLHEEEKSAASNKYFVSLVMAHEIAHTWFGNMVTMRWWDDLWLNEGFANTLMYFALDHINPDWKVYDLQLVDNVYPVMTKDSLLTSHAISTPIEDPDQIPQYFDSISYDKGMAVLRLLRGFLGWDEFQKGLKMYVNRYKFKNAEMSQLWHTFSEAVNNKYNVSMIMDTWTRQMGFPVVTVKFIKTADGDEFYQLTQERFLLNPKDHNQQGTSQFNYIWEIPFTFHTQMDRRPKTKWLSSATSQLMVPYGEWIIGNVDYTGFYRTNYDEEMWMRIIAQLHGDPKKISTANRAGLINDAFNLARANKLDYKIPLNLSLYLHKEDEYVPWRAFLDSIHFVEGMLATSNSYGMLQRYVRQLVAPQYRKIGVSDKGDLLEKNLRKILVETAASVGVPDAVDWAKNAFHNWISYGSRVSPDYASVIFSVGIKYGGEKEWSYLWEKAQQTRVASEADSMKSALGAAQQPWLLWRFARWTLDSDKVRMQDVGSHFRYYSTTSLGRSVALDFLLVTWQEINEKFGVDVYLIRDVIYAITSLVNTEFEYKQLETLYRDRPPAGVAKQAAENSLALIKSNINWMDLNYNTIHGWLEKYSPPPPT